MSKIKAGFALCGSFCTIADSIKEMKKLIEKEYEIFPICSEIMSKTDTRFGKAEDIKEERFQRLNDKVKENCLKSNLKYVGREMEVLVESFYERRGVMINTGKTRNNKTVHIQNDKNLIGEFVNVKISGAKTWYLNGELV